MEDFLKCLYDIRDSLQTVARELQKQDTVPTNKEAERALTVDEIADLFGCSRECVLQNLRRPHSPGMKTSPEKRAEWRVIPSEYAAFLKQLAKESKAG